MKNLTAVGCVVLLSLVSAPQGRAQIFGDEKGTRIFEHELASIAEADGGAFVSSCAGPEPDAAAILIFPIGHASGSLELLVHGKVYNAAEVQLKKGQVTVMDSMGGLWSQNKMKFYADQLSHHEFKLELGAPLQNLPRQRPGKPCPKFDYVPPLPSGQ